MKTNIQAEQRKQFEQLAAQLLQELRASAATTLTKQPAAKILSKRPLVSMASAMKRAGL